MSKTCKMVVTVAEGARRHGVAPRTLANHLNKRSIDPTAMLIAGRRQMPLYPETTIASLALDSTVDTSV